MEFVVTMSFMTRERERERERILHVIIAKNASIDPKNDGKCGCI